MKDLFERDVFRIIYRNVSERTARRDLDSLTHQKLIVATKNGNFAINLGVME